MARMYGSPASETVCNRQTGLKPSYPCLEGILCCTVGVPFRWRMNPRAGPWELDLFDLPGRHPERVMGYTASARLHLQKALELEPTGAVAPQLLAKRQR